MCQQKAPADHRASLPVPVTGLLPGIPVREQGASGSFVKHASPGSSQKGPPRKCASRRALVETTRPQCPNLFRDDRTSRGAAAQAHSSRKAQRGDVLSRAPPEFRAGAVPSVDVKTEISPLRNSALAIKNIAGYISKESVAREEIGGIDLKSFIGLCKRGPSVRRRLHRPPFRSASPWERRLLRAQAVRRLTSSK